VTAPGSGVPEPLTRLADGTVKQISPVTGTVVWTVPGRSDRPVPTPARPVRPLEPHEHRDACAFCADRLLETPPERARLVCDGGPGAGAPTGATAEGADPGVLVPADGRDDVIRACLPSRWQVVREAPAEALWAQRAEFRRIPNLFPILPLGYWRADHGMQVPDEVLARARAYLASPAGRAHLVGVLSARAQAGTPPSDPIAAMPDADLLERALGLFASTHDLIVSRRHYVEGATTDDALCSSGQLTAEEHNAFMVLTVDALRDLTESNPHARYVSVFQNWLRPAGASFDHLHKQLVAIDEWGPLMDGVIERLVGHPQLFNDEVAEIAVRRRLVIADNEQAIALAGVGHRYPTIEIYATSPAQRPWEHEPESILGVSQLLHACHAATGPGIATNEEWHYRPVGAGVAMPWRINLKWRVSTLAGFEGGTRIHVNTVDPFTLRDRVVAALDGLRTAGRIAPIRIGDECAHRTGVLQYARG
jgi:galactose-1-phosphate uridylyltransferase